MTDKVLVIEDEPALQETLAYNLTRQGYEVITVGDGKEGIAATRREQPDLLILDLMLPGVDGIEVCRVLRQEMNMPILMLTAKADEIDKIVGLEVGADDYMTKPFSMRELMARVKAMLRRERLIREELAALDVSPSRQQVAFGNLVIDEARHEVRRDNAPLAMKPKEYELLLFLARQRGIVVSRDLILERVWGWDFDGGSRTVDVHIRWLREKSEDDPGNPVRIVTVRGIGYRFEG